MSAIEDIDNSQNNDSNSENNNNLIADSQGESKQENENVDESPTSKTKPKGKASEIYGNKNTNKKTSKKKFTGLREQRNLEFRPPREWEIGKILPASIFQDERKFKHTTTFGKPQNNISKI